MRLLILFWQSNDNLNINTVDQKGQFPLQLAVKNQDEQMVDYFLSIPGIQIKDSLLHAIKQENAAFTEKLLMWKDQ